MTEKIHDMDQARAEIAAPPSGSGGGDKAGETCCAAATTSRAPGGPGEVGASTPKKSGRIAGLLKMAACCGGMLLLLPALGLVNLGGLAAVGGSLLSIAAVLACPVGMYLMMRAMMKREQGGSPVEQKKRLSDDTVNQGVKR